MRIALVSPYDWCVDGGVNMHVANLARYFRQMGHDATIFAPASDPGSLDGECVPMGRPWPVRSSGSVQRIALGLLSSHVKAALAEGAFDVVHAHEPLMPVLPYHFLRHSRAANIGTFHAAKEGGNRIYRYTRPFTQRWFRRLDGKITVSVAATGLVSRYFRGYFNVIPNGIDYGHFAPPRAPLPEFADGRFNILFVGRPEKRKGLTYLLQAYTELRQRYPDQMRLIVVGAGDFSRYERAMRGMDDVVFRRNVSHEALPSYHWSSSVYVSPATGNESQGIAVLEAMAAARPVVVSNIEGFATMVTHGREGLLVAPRSPQDIEAALVRLYEDAGLRAQLAERAHSRAREYDWGDIAQRVLSYYERLVFERRRNPAGDPYDAPA